jgi:hypothetical protein
MPQKRLVIKPSEVIHIEINCKTCSHSTIVPVKEPPLPDMESLTKHVSFSQCPWCGNKYDPQFQDNLTKLRKFLWFFTIEPSFATSFVIQQGDGNT